MSSRKLATPVPRTKAPPAKVITRRKNPGNRRTKNKEVRGREVTIRSPAADCQIVYGQMRIGGVLTFAHVDGDYLHLVVSFAGHKINRVLQLYLDKKAIPLPGTHPAGQPASGAANGGKYVGKVFCSISTGDDAQVANADLAAALPTKWTSEHRQRGIAHAYIKLKFDAEVFPEGIPEIEFLVEGKSDIYDPRGPSTGYSNNAALVIADYLKTKRFWAGPDYADIDEANLIAAADICDQLITLADASTERRYMINGAFDTATAPQEVLEDMAAAIGGDIVYQAGVWRIYPGAWRAPALTLTEDDLRSEIRIETKQSRRDSFNRVRGKFIGTDYEVDDFPPVVNATYLAEDGGEEIWEDLSLNFVTSSAAAQRLANLTLERARQQITVSCRAGLRALDLQVCDTVNLTLSRYGWSAKPFEVRAWSLSTDANQGIEVELTLQETASGVFDWAGGSETVVDLAPNTTLPAADTVTAPTALTLESGTSQLDTRIDGTIFSRLKASWTVAAESFSTSGGFIELQYKKSSASDWIPVGLIPGAQAYYYILDVADGVAYDVRVRGVNGLGAVSSWVTQTNHVVVGKTQPPADVGGFSGAPNQFGILLNWTAAADLDLDYYEIRQGATWAGATLVTQIKSTSFSVNIKTAGSYTFLIKAVDTSGNYSTNAASAVVVISAPAAPVAAITTDGGNYALSWGAPISQHEIGAYRVSHGATFGGSTFITDTKSLSYAAPAAWSGLRRFWVAAIDVAGNVGSGGSVDLTINAPGQVQSLISEVIDNNVLLRWQAPASGTLPVAYYKVYSGDVFAGAAVIGQITGTFAAIFETASANKTYWVAAFDSAGNQGTERSIAVQVNLPPDFILRADVNADPTTGTLTNAEAENGYVVLPVDNLEDYQDHFINNSWTTPQDQINANYPLWIEPSETTGSIVVVHDLGATVAEGTVVSASVTEETIAGSVTITPTISVSTDNVSYTNYPGVWSVFVSNFRYIKLTLDATAANSRSLKKISNIKIRAATKKIGDSGVVTANSGDSGGTTVNFNVSFLDVTSITLTPKYNASYPVVAVYDFTDAPNPTSFKVLCYRTDTGARVTNEVRWYVEGV